MSYNSLASHIVQHDRTSVRVDQTRAARRALDLDLHCSPANVELRGAAQRASDPRFRFVKLPI